MNRRIKPPILPQIHRLCELGLKIQAHTHSDGELALTTEYPDTVLEFVKHASHKRWNDFEYQPELAAEHIRDADFVAKATLNELRTLLTYFVRGERFCDGHWATLINDGTLNSVVRRLRQFLPRFEFSSLKYLNIWLSAEGSWVQTMKEGNRDEKLTAMAKFGGSYRISRNLHRKFEKQDGGQCARLAPVLDIIDQLDRSQFEGDELESGVRAVVNKISGRYGGRGVLSATTKFLWLKFQKPIVIYDRQARLALELKSEDLRGYLTRWREAYVVQAKDVAAACGRLPEVREYWVDPNALSGDSLRHVLNSTWFQERVFDIYLWTVGASK